MHGYKAFNLDWTCRGVQYQIGETYIQEGKPVICEHGMHFCPQLLDVFRYYPENEAETVVAEVEALGNIDQDTYKCCTNEMRVIRQVSWEEIAKAKRGFGWVFRRILAAILINVLFVLLKYKGVPTAFPGVFIAFWLWSPWSFAAALDEGHRLKKSHLMAWNIANASTLIAFGFLFWPLHLMVYALVAIPLALLFFRFYFS